MGYSIIQGTGDGSTNTFAINFPLGFLSRDDVKFWVVGEVDGGGNPVYRTITWINDGMISIVTAPINGAKYEIIRTVSKTSLVHVYENGEPIEEVNLDDSNKQVMMAVQEVLDGRFSSPLGQDLDVGGNKIVNMADGTDPHDAITKEQLDAAILGDGGATALTLIRPKLTAARTYYVRTDGSDSNNGLTNTAGGAFLTIPAAVSAALSIDMNGHDVLVQVADGTYTNGLSLAYNPVGPGQLSFQGNVSTPANCIIQATNENAAHVGNHATLNITGFKLVTITGGNCLDANQRGIINASALEFGTCADTHVHSFNNSIININGNYKISGNALQHYSVHDNSDIAIDGSVITVSGSRTFTTFTDAEALSLISFISVTFSTNVATGKRYVGDSLAIIQTSGAGSTFFPGDVSGTSTNGAIYL